MEFSNPGRRELNVRPSLCLRRTGKLDASSDAGSSPPERGTLMGATLVAERLLGLKFLTMHQQFCSRNSASVPMGGAPHSPYLPVLAPSIRSAPSLNTTSLSAT